MLFLLLCLTTGGSWGTSLIFGFVSYFFVFAFPLIAVFKQPFRQGEHSVDKVSLYLLRDFVVKLSREPVARPIVHAVFDKSRTVVGDTQFEDEIGLWARHATTFQVT